MNRDPFLFSDEDEAPPPPEPKVPRRVRSRAETLGWFAAVLFFATVAWLLLFPLVALGVRLALSLGCLLLGAACIVCAWRELR